MLDYFYMRQGGQAAQLNEFLSSPMPLTVKHTTAAGVFTSILGPRNPLTTMLSGFSSLEAIDAAGLAMSAVPEFLSAVEKLEAGGEPAYDRCDRMILRAPSFSQEHRAPEGKAENATRL